MSTGLKAFEVIEREERRGGIVFAKSDVEARRLGANEFNDGEFSGMGVARREELDQYIGKGVPASVMIEMGWNFECWGCDEEINSDWLHDNHMTSEQVVGNEGGQVYCCWTCKANAAAREARKEAFGREYASVMKTMISDKYGSEAIFHTEGRYQPVVNVEEQGGYLTIHSATVYFDFPGQTLAPATMEYRSRGDLNCGPPEMEIWCTRGDQEIFEAWSKTARRMN